MSENVLLNTKENELVWNEQEAIINAEQAGKSPLKFNKEDALAYAYGLILDTLSISIETAQAGNTNLAACSNAMESLNKLEDNVNFENITTIKADKYYFQEGTYTCYTDSGAKVTVKITNSEISAADVQAYKEFFHIDLLSQIPGDHIDNTTFMLLSADNDQIQKVRDGYSNTISMIQQNSQIQTSALNTTSDYAAQAIQQEGSINSLWQTLATLLGQMLNR